MVRCKVCAAEVTTDVCPYCGAKVQKTVAKEKIPILKKEPEAKKETPEDILKKIDEAKAKLVERCRNSVVKVYCEFRKVLSTGTGFVLEGGIIVTNAHVVTKDEQEIYNLFIEYADSLDKPIEAKKSYAKVLYVSKEEDIAILKPDRIIPTGVTPLKLHIETTKQGEAVFTIGNPLHYRFTYIEGAVANPEYKKNDSSKYSYVQTTLTLNHGNSGGPVFNMNGEVIGMSTFSELKLDMETNENKEILGYGFCVSAKAINDALLSLK